jgi:Flp pilus assembly protein TadG
MTLYPFRAFHQFHQSRRGTVAIYVALMAPLLAGVVALGAEVSGWSAAKLDLQRTADAAALAGAITYNFTNGNTTAAATAASNLAQMNGLSVAQITPAPSAVPPVKTGSRGSIQVNVQKVLPLSMARIISSQTSVTVKAVSTAELIANTTTTTTAGSGGQPCLLALQSAANGGTGITANGSITVNAPGCTLVSNATFNDAGGSSLTMSGIYAVSTVTIPCWATINGTSSNNGCSPWPASGMLQANTAVHSGATAVPDPYGSNTAMQAAIANASATTGPSIACSNQNCTATQNGTQTALPSASGSAVYGSYCTGQGTSSVTCNMRPGNYGSFNVSSGGPYYFNFAAGGYVFNGNVSLNNNTTTNGTGVTIFTTGTFSGANTFNFSLTAPSTTVMPTPSTAGPWQIQGVALAGTSHGVSTPALKMSGNPQFYINGVVYFPNGLFDSEGSTGLGNNSTVCMEIIAGSINLSGSSYMASGCSSVGATSFTSVPATSASTTTYAAALVQ